MINETELHQGRKKLLRAILTGETLRGQKAGVREYQLEKELRLATTTPATSQLPLRRTSQAFKEYLTGFWEGDGGLAVTESRSIGVSFTQAKPTILISVQEELEGGYLYTPTKGCNYYRLVFRGKQAAEVLDVLRKNVVGAYRIKQLSQALPIINLTLVTLHAITPNWFVGFWDAEGHSYSSSYTYIGVSNKEKQLIDEVRKLWGCGHIQSRKDGVSVWSLSSLPKYREKFKEVYNLLLDKSLNEGKKRKLVEDVTFGKLLKGVMTPHRMLKEGV